MNIDEGKLQDLLNRRKKHIKSLAGLWESLVCLVGYVLSLYKWFSIDDMKADKNLRLKNSETIRFVEENF